MVFARSLLLSASFACLSAAAFGAEPTIAPADAPVVSAVSSSAPVTRAELPALVKEILLNQPEIMMEAAQKLREKQQADEVKKTKEALAKYKNDLFNDTSVPSIGDAKTADVTVVEFFDYHCGYCKQVLDSVVKVAGEDKKIRFVFREFPILSEDSVAASRAALAVNRLDKSKYFDFHVALMKRSGAFDENALMETAKKVGIDGAKLKAEMASPEITAALDKNRQIATDLGIHGTPAMIMGDELVPGALSYDELKQAIAAVRGSKSATSQIEKERAAEAPKN